MNKEIEGLSSSVLVSSKFLWRDENFHLLEKELVVGTRAWWAGRERPDP